MLWAVSLKIGNTATALSGSAPGSAAKSIFATPTWDVIVIAVFFIAAFFYAMIAGKNRVVLGIVVSYFTFALWQVLPIGSLVKDIGEGESFALKITLFFALFFFTFVLSAKSSVVPGFKIKKENFGVLAKTFLFAFLQVGFFLNMIFSFLPQKGKFEISPISKFLFYSEYSSLAWVALPIIAIILLRRKDPIVQ
jgi:hypothetical protein